MKPIQQGIQIHAQHVNCNGRTFMYADFEAVEVEEVNDPKPPDHLEMLKDFGLGGLAIYLLVNLFLYGPRIASSARGMGVIFVIIALGIWRLSGRLIPANHEPKLFSLVLYRNRQKHHLYTSRDRVEVMNLRFRISERLELARSGRRTV
jgi:hypothetical protein